MLEHAYYYGYKNQIDRNTLEETTVATTFNMYKPSKVVEGTDASGNPTSTYNSSNYSVVSFAGGVAGVVDLGAQNAEDRS